MHELGRVDWFLLFVLLLGGAALVWCVVYVWCSKRNLAMVDAALRSPGRLSRNREQTQLSTFKGECLDQMEDIKFKRRHACNHRKGGTMDRGQYVQGHGDAIEYAVFTHTYPWGDKWVRCLRCGRTWKPGDWDYEWALKLPTNNQPSSSCQFHMTPEGLKQAREGTQESGKV